MPLDALEGFTIGVTADRRWQQQADLLARRGAEVLHGPTMATQYLADVSTLLVATDAVIAGVDYTVVTTGIGVRAWFEAAETSGVADGLRRAIDRSQILCRGPKAAAALQVAGVTSSPALLSESLAELLQPALGFGLGGATVAFQHHGSADATWVQRLASEGAQVLEVPVYRWHRPPSDAAAVRLVRSVCAGDVDAVTFTSAPAVANLVRIAADCDLDGPLRAAFNHGGVIAACVGPLCAAGARAEGIESPVAPEVGRLGLLVRVVTDALAARSVRWRSQGQPVVLQGGALAMGATTLSLSGTERRIFAQMAEKPGAVVSKSTLARHLGTTPRAVEASIGRFRTRVGPVARQLIQTVQGRGYRLDIGTGANNLVEVSPL